jgi:tetratricopeptide (TPR) repeat protein
LAFWLVDLGDGLEALAQFEKAQPLYDEFLDDPWVQLRRRWLRARIYAGLGDLDLAVPAFAEVRRTALDRELPYELAMISLEEAIVHLDRGDKKQVQELADEMVPIFRSRELHAHALAAVYLFQQAALDKSATVDLARQVLRYLQKARNNRYLRFHRSRRKA